MDGGHTLTYSELLVRVNTAASCLRRLLDNTRDPVAVWLPNDHRFIISMLAINALGRAFLPLDINFPASRIQEILTEAKISRVIGTSSAFVLNPETGLIDIDQCMESEAIPFFISNADADDLAYILYTSGSSGKPKGVYQNQRNLLHDIMHFREATAILDTDKIAMFYSPVVISGIRSIYGSLLSGAGIYLSDLKKDGLGMIGAFLRNHRITMYRSLPGVFRAFLRLEKDLFESIRIVILSGDRVYNSDFDLFKRFFPGNALFSIGLGSTEVSTCYATWNIGHTAYVPETLMPMGFPVEDRPYQIFNSLNELVLDGQEGEIVVRSRYLSLGYWKNPGLTALSYTSHTDGTRSFHTGDMGYILPDGNLYFLGRKDSQVKINGNRVETDEINNKICLLPGIRMAHTMASVKNGNASLSAFIEAETKELTERKVRKLLEEKLPFYMVPAFICILDKMPLLNSYKIDLQALKEIESGMASTGPINSSPADRLKLLWQNHTSVLSGFDENRTFHESGGSSIEIVYLCSEIESTFDLNVPAAYMHSSVTPSLLLALIDSWHLSRKFSTMPGEKSDFPLLFVFQPVAGLSGPQAMMIKKMMSEFTTVMVPYPIRPDWTYDQISLKNCALQVIETFFPDPFTGSFIFLGVCNGNNLAQSVASRLLPGKKPLFHVNIDFVHTASFPEKKEQDLNKLTLLKKEFTRKGFRKTLGNYILHHLRPLKNLNTSLYLNLMMMTARFCSIPPASVQNRLLDDSLHFTNAGIPLILVASRLLLSLRHENLYGWQKLYSSSVLVETPYSHTTVLSDPDSQRMILNQLKEQLQRLNHPPVSSE